MTEMRGPVRITHSTTYRDADQDPGTCETPEYFGSDLWIIDGTTTTPDNSDAAWLCRTCPKRDTCPTQADKNPSQHIGTIRGAKAYFGKGSSGTGSAPGIPFQLCAHTGCHTLFASTKKRQDYCTTRCRHNAERQRSRHRSTAA
jgi:hypothetical protein